MARMEEWEKEVRLELKRETWSLTGERSLVKVEGIPPGRPSSPVLRKALGGYFTTRDSLLAKNPEQIRAALGLPVGSFDRGARVYRFLRLPAISEYEYQLTTRYPDGLAYTFMSDPAYPEGKGSVHQWQLKRGVSILGEFLLDLLPGQRLPQDLWLKRRV